MPPIKTRKQERLEQAERVAFAVLIQLVINPDFKEVLVENTSIGASLCDWLLKCQDMGMLRFNAGEIEVDVGILVDESMEIANELLAQQIDILLSDDNL